MFHTLIKVHVLLLSFKFYIFNWYFREIALRNAHGLEADVWSLGCMLYTMLVGRPPFDTHGVRNTLNRVILAEFSLPELLSPDAKDLITSLLKKNPAERIRLDRKCKSFLCNTPHIKIIYSLSYQNGITEKCCEDGHIIVSVFHFFRYS